MKTRNPKLGPMLIPEEPAAAPVRPSAPSRWAPKGEQEFVDFFMYLLRAPVIVMPGWEDSFRDRWDDVLMNRLLHGREIFGQEMCTEYEAMLYVSSATLVAPPSHDWYVIYMWLFRRWNKEAANQVGLDDVPETLNVNQQEDLAGLRHWIFKGQMLRLKEKGQTPKASLGAKRKELEAEQPKLF